MSSSNGNGNGHHVPPGSPKDKFRARTPVERRARRNRVAELMLAATPHREILRFVSSEYEVSARTVKLDIRWVSGRWAREDARGVEEARARIRRRLERLAEKCEKNGEYHGAIRANAILAKIHGLIVPPSVQVAVSNTVNVGAQDDEAAALLRDREVADALSSAFARRAGRGPESGSRLDAPSAN